MPQLLAELKAGGYKIVHMKREARDDVTLPQYDEELAKESKLPTVSQRPTSSVVRDGRLTAAIGCHSRGGSQRAAPLHLKAAHFSCGSDRRPRIMRIRGYAAAWPCPIASKASPSCPPTA